MKKTLSICLLIAGFTLNATAQYIDGTAATKASQESFTQSMEDWDGVRIAIERNAYHLPDIEIPGGDTYENITISTSIAMSYLHGFALNKKKPIFLETGFGIKWGMYDIKSDEEIYQYTGVTRERLNLFTFEIPASFGYRFDTKKPDWKIYTYTGLYLRMHITGKLEAQDRSGYTAEANVFDKDEFYPTFERFQCGWQLGCDFQCNQFVFGLSYGVDLNKIWVDTRTFTSSLNFGYRF